MMEFQPTNKKNEMYMSNENANQRPMKLTTVRQRMAVYQAALKLYEKGEIEYMCLVIGDLTGERNVTFGMEFFVPELYNQRPKPDQFSWYPPTKRNVPKRISALTAAIKECRKKLKSKK